MSIMPLPPHDDMSGACAAPFTISINGRFLGQRLTGVQRVGYEVTLALNEIVGANQRPGLCVRILLPDQACLDTFEGLGCSNIIPILARGGSGHLWEQITLPRHVGDGRLLCLGNSAPLLSLLSRQPPAVMLHDQAHMLFPKDYSVGYRVVHRLLEAIIIRRSAPLLLVSEAERAQLARTHPSAARLATLAPNGSWSRDQVQATVGRDQGADASERYGLFVGGVNKRKNSDAALAVAIQLARQRSQPFRFVGPTNTGFNDRIPADVRHLVRSVGYVEDAALPDLYRGAAFLLYPSFYEASGLPPSEAMTFGCPVIASDLPVMRERCGDAALYCDPYDVPAICHAAMRVLDEPSLAASLAIAGRVRVRSLTWRNQALAIVDAMMA
jgi:glycosyltransferase involved in cell wall biosynthesis